MKLMTMKQYMKMSTTALIRKINKELRVMPKVKLARLCYNLTKSKLPRLKKITSRQRRFGGAYRQRALSVEIGKHKKRKFTRKQLAAQRLFAKRARAGTLRKRKRRR